MIRYLKKLRRIEIALKTFLLITLILACSSMQAEKTEPDPDQPVANKPKLMTGEQWVTSTRHGIRSSKVISVKEDGSFIIEVQNEDGSIIFHQYYDENHLLVTRNKHNHWRDN